MSLDLYSLENWVYGNVASSFTTGQTTLSMVVGHTARFTSFPAYAMLWNVTDYKNPAEAFRETGDAEIIKIVSKSGDTFDEIVRGVAPGIPAIATTPGKTYRVAIGATREQWDKVFRGPPDGAGPFDAVLSGTPADVTGAVSREVHDDGSTAHSCIKSIQGGPRNGQVTGIHIGDTAAPDDFRMLRTILTAGDNHLRMLFDAIMMMRMEDNGAIAFHSDAPGESAQSVLFGEKVGFRRSISFNDASATISGGSLTVTSPIVKVTGEGSVDDELENITGNGYSGQNSIIILTYNSAGVITVKSDVGNISLQRGEFVIGGTNRFLVLIDDSGTWRELFRIPWFPYFRLEDVKADTTDGGTFTQGAWQTRTLNSAPLNLESVITNLSSNQFTLLPGSYRLWISAPAYDVGSHQIRLRNITDGSTALLGTTEHASGTQTRSFIEHYLSFGPAAKAFEVQHRCQTTKATDGFGINAGFGVGEIYTTVLGIKES